MPKPNGTICLDDDFKMTINPVLKVDQYPLPKMEDIFAASGKGVLYSKIDCSGHICEWNWKRNQESCSCEQTQEAVLV